MKLEILKYLITGVVNTLTDFMIFSLLFYVFGIGIILSNSLSFLVSVIQSFFINKHWTFSGSNLTTSTKKQMLSFFGVNLVGLVISNITIVLSAYVMHVLLAKLSATVLVFVWGFIMSKKFVFK